MITSSLNSELVINQFPQYQYPQQTVIHIKISNKNDRKQSKEYSRRKIITRLIRIISRLSRILLEKFALQPFYCFARAWIRLSWCVKKHNPTINHHISKCILCDRLSKSAHYRDCFLDGRWLLKINNHHVSEWYVH